MASLSVEGVSKRYGPVLALDKVSAEFQPGEIHAVLGENGAGKSTLMNVMSGFADPDSGVVRLDGKPIPLGKAFECKRLGIEMIHQHFSLVPEFTVAENLALARLPTLASIADSKALAKSAIDQAKQFGWELDPDAKAGQLPVGVQQRIEILKALAGSAHVLIFDEPTAVLSPAEVDDLFRVLRRLKDEGRVVVLIAHKLTEVLSIADRVTVLRKGRLVASALRAEVDAAKLAEWMVGEMPAPSGHSEQRALREGVVVKDLIVKGDRGEIAIDGASFEIRRGEILGFGGVDGNGQIELAECLAQIRPAKSGTISWSGKVGYIPQDRRTDGLALGMTIQDNMLLSGFDQSHGPFLSGKAIKNWASSLIREYEIKAESPSDLAGSLSGGNQQKVVVSRVLSGNPNLLVVANPGRGLDIKAAQYVHERILQARDNGAAVALFSADLDELFMLSDRVLFMSKGRLLDRQDAGAVVGAEP